MKKVKGQKAKGKSLRIVLFPFYFLLFTSSAYAQTALATAAKALNPGQWVAFTTNNFNNGADFQVECHGTASLFQYQDKAVWIPTANQALVVGGIHMSIKSESVSPPCYGTEVWRYTDSNNTWGEVQNIVPNFDNGWSSQGYWADGHDYHNNTASTVTSDAYHKQNSSGKVMRYNANTASWSQCTVALPGFASWQATASIDYFPDRNSLVFADGDWGVFEMVLNNGDCTTNPWIQRAAGMGGGMTPQLQMCAVTVPASGCYNNQAAYSLRCNCIVMGGNTRMYRYYANGTFVAVNMSGAPPLMKVPDAAGGTIYTVDPVSGMILMWSGTNANLGVYQYDPLNDTWSFVSNTSPIFPTGMSILSTVAIPISTYGVIMFIQVGDGGPGGRVYLYKYAQAVADTTPPSVPGIATGTPVGSSQINLSWAASSDPESGVSSYQVDRCTGATCTTGFTQIATPTTNSYNDTKLTSQTAYRYRIRAVNGQGGISGNSTISAAITTGTADTVAPVVAVSDPPNTTPVSAGTAGSYNLIGTATDAVGVTTITLVNDRGGTYTVNTSGTSVSWNRSVNLFNGTNVITTTAQDAEGNNSTAVVRTITTTIVGPSLTPTPTATSPGAVVNVAFTGVASPTTRDWIGLYPVGAPDSFNPAYPWAYSVGSPTCTQTSVPFSASVPPAVASGSCNFIMPTAAGSYNFRMFSNDAETNPLAVTATVTSTAVVDTTAPTTPTGLNAIAINNTINLSWIASSDNIGVTGYRVERCSGTNCGSTPSNFVQVYTPSVNTQVDSGLAATTPYSYRVRATDAAGNLSPYSAIASATTGAVVVPPPSDFLTRCQASGVILCEGFDSNSVLDGTYGNNRGSFNNAAVSGSQYAPNNYDGTCGSAHIYNCPLIDTSIKASGAGSMRFDMPSGTDAVGQWFTNFSPDLLTQFQAGGEFWIQWRQRFNDGYVNNIYAGGNGEGPKIMDISAGDIPGCTPSTSTNCRSSNTDIEIIMQNAQQNGYPILYGGLVWSGGWGQYQAFADWSFSTVLNTQDQNMQNARPNPPGCYYHMYKDWRTLGGNCFGYYANEWMTFKMHVRLGPLGSITGIPAWTGSLIELKMAREGQATQPVISFTGDLYAATAWNAAYGKVWFMNYITGFVQQPAPLSQTWYDDLIISRNDIADPGTGTGTPGPGITITSPTSNPTTTVNTATISLGGTIQ